GGTSGSVVVGSGGSVVCNWIGMGDDYSWSDPANWDLVPSPGDGFGPGDSLRFGNGSPINTSNDLLDTPHFHSIEFASGDNVIWGGAFSADSITCAPSVDIAYVA